MSLSVSMSGCEPTDDDANLDDDVNLDGAEKLELEAVEFTAPESEHAATLAELSKAGTWEPIAHPLKVATEPFGDVAYELTSEQLSQLAEAAEDDQTWYSAQNERYEALYVTKDGAAFGRLGPAPTASSQGSAADPGAGAVDSFEPSELQADPEASGQAVPAIDEFDNPNDPSFLRITALNWNADRRVRQWVPASLTGYPFRVIGALSGSGNTQSSSCSGWKVGPRAVATAAHCVMNSLGDITLSGFFNPGQTNTSALNGSIPWSGVFLRDYRIDPAFDYAVIYLDDSAATVSLGYLGVNYWTSASNYNSKWATLAGYPCGPNQNCGAITSQKCKASPRSDDRCDGWMYSHYALLYQDSFRPDNLLEYDNDMSSGQSGSPVYLDNFGTVAINTRSINGTCMGPRFRQSMWDDICTWIAHPSKQSAFGTHPNCN